MSAPSRFANQFSLPEDAITEEHGFADNVSLYMNFSRMGMLKSKDEFPGQGGGEAGRCQLIQGFFFVFCSGLRSHLF